MITLRWTDDSNVPHFTRPRVDGDVFFVEVPRNAFTGEPLKLIGVEDASMVCTSKLLEEFG